MSVYEQGRAPLEEWFSVVSQLEPYRYAADDYCDDGGDASKLENGQWKP